MHTMRRIGDNIVIGFVELNTDPGYRGTFVKICVVKPVRKIATLGDKRDQGAPDPQWQQTIAAGVVSALNGGNSGNLLTSYVEWIL